MLAIYRRELQAFFGTLVGFGITGAFVVVMMLLSLMLDPLGGGGDWFKRGELSMRTFFGVFPWVAAVVLPAVAMRLWAEDRRQATFEMLMTLPIPTWKVALGKYGAALTFLLFMLAATCVYPIMLAQWGKPDWGPVVGGYVACFVLGAGFIAVGMFVSGLTDNQALAFFVALLMCLGIVGVGELRGLLGDLARTNPDAALTHLVTIPVFMLGLLAAAVGRDRILGAAVSVLAVVVNGGVYLMAQPDPKQLAEKAKVSGETVIAALGQISVLEHFKEIGRGVLTTNSLIFFASYVVLFVTLNVMSLESRRYS
ncbi:MAG: ABC-2 transporter permease [Planctomycetes bacterium]|nr:ABC-2 transporter permease [Planctomycetota bacterium]